MDKDNSTAFGFDWAETQRRFLDAVSALGNDRNTSNPWQQALEFWWRRASPAVSDDQGVLSNLLRQSQALLGLNEQFGRMLQDMAACGPDGDWQKKLNTHFDDLKAHFDELAGGAVRASASSWQGPADSWAKAFSWLSPLPAGFDSNSAAAFPQLPSLGGGRRVQEQHQRALELWRTYLNELHAFQAELAGVGARAVDHLRERILNPGTGDIRITSLRALYDLWGEACEQAFAVELASEEYAAHYGRVVDALIAFKRHSQVMVDEVLRALNLPTRNGMETMQKRQQEIRRDLRSASEREQDQARAIDDLKRELEELRRTLGATGSRGGNDGDEQA